MSVQELEAIPALGRLYLTAASNAARSRLSSSTAPKELPAARHTVARARVDLDNLTNFQRLVMHSAQDTLPSGYVHTFAFPVAMSVMAREDFPLPLLGLVHLRNDVRHLRPIHYSEPLSVTAWAENLAGHRSGTQVELVAEVRSGEELVWTGRSVYLAKGVFLPRFDRPASSGERPEFVPPLPTAQWRLGPDAGRNYARVSGDFNPIHLSALSARALGMKRSIAHGMYMASRVVGETGPAMQEPFEWNIEFESPVFLPATVSVRISESGSPGERGATTFAGWNQRSRRRHFHGWARPLGAGTQTGAA